MPIGTLKPDYNPGRAHASYANLTLLGSDAESKECAASSRLVWHAGNFDTARCIVCRTEVHQLTVQAAVDAATPCRCPECNGLVKPDIVFFGRFRCLQ